MSKTLVIILSETRAHELTFNNFKKNVLDELQADLCVCIGVKPDYNYDNPFYQTAKYRFLYDEPDDFGDAFEYAYQIISKDRPKYECLNNINALYGKLQHPQEVSSNVTPYGAHETINLDYEEEEMVHHTNKFPDARWTNQLYGIKKSFHQLVPQHHDNTYKKPLYWREFLKVKDQYLGGIKDELHQHGGSAGILIFFRWFLLKNLTENKLLDEYDRFIITRSDFIYQLPHPNVVYMDNSKIWVPDGEYYGGYTDRHVILSKSQVEPYLNIFTNMVLKSNEYFMKLSSYGDLNLEKLIKFHLEQNGQQVREFPYVMYSIRLPNGTTRWSAGTFYHDLGYCIKYNTEYEKSTAYKQQFIKSKMNIRDFYKKII